MLAIGTPTQAPSDGSHDRGSTPLSARLPANAIRELACTHSTCATRPAALRRRPGGSGTQTSSPSTQVTTYTVQCNDADPDETEDDFTDRVTVVRGPSWLEL